MKLISLKQPPKVRSVLRAVVAGIVAHPLLVFLLGIVYWALRPFVWAAIYSEPYRPPPGPYPPESGEWLFMQGINFCASVVAGVLVAYWSPQRSKQSLVILVAISFAGLLFTRFPLETSIFRNALYALGSPFGILTGALFLRRWQPSGGGA